jgi:hypothetical protein
MVRPALLVAHRADLMEDWMRTINRLRRLMVGISPMAECALTLTRIRRSIDPELPRSNACHQAEDVTDDYGVRRLSAWIRDDLRSTEWWPTPRWPHSAESRG